MPVASPVLLIVATLVFDELQVTELVRSPVLPSVNVPVAMNCCVVPLGIERLLGVTLMEASVGVLGLARLPPLQATKLTRPHIHKGTEAAWVPTRFMDALLPDGMSKNYISRTKETGDSLLQMLPKHKLESEGIDPGDQVRRVDSAWLPGQVGMCGVQEIPSLRRE